MYFRTGRFTYALQIWSLLSVLWMSEFHPFAVMGVLFSSVCFFFQERFSLGNRGLAVGTLVCLLICFLCTRAINYLDVGRFLGIGTISLAILGTVLTGFLLLLKKEGPVRRAPLFAACGTLIACSVSGQLLSVVVVSGLGLLFVLLAYREAQGLAIKGRMAFPLLITFLLTTFLSALAGWSETRLSYLASLFELAPPAGISFPAATSLRSLQRWSGDDVVVMRGYGSNPPLYLVGRTFTEFDTKNFWRWLTDNAELYPDQQTLQETPDGPKAISLFAKSDDPEAKPGLPFRLEYPRGGYGFTFYAPRNYYGLAVDLSTIQRYGDGMLQAASRDEVDGNYYLIPYTDGWQRHGTPEILPAVEQERCLALPENVSPEVSRLAAEICGDIADPEKKADFITAYLQQNFTYGYDYPFESSETALEEFLLKRPPAHCEFFATAGALMMRSQGIPTRYINGFVLQERSMTGGYYVVRLKHAHAWVEAYVPGKGWVTYDPTPPGTLDDMESRAGLGNAFLELLSNFWRKFLAFFSLSPMEMIYRLRTLITSLTPSDYGKLVALAALYYLWKRYRGQKTKPVESPRYVYQPGRHEALTPLLDAVTSALPKAEWQRRPSESPQRWRDRLTTVALDPETVDQLDEFLQLYYRARYGKRVDDETVARLTTLSQELRNRFRGTSSPPRERGENKKNAG